MSTQGIKEEDNKLFFELDWEFIEGMAARMALNKGKYPPFNWMKDIDPDKLKQANMRHNIALMKGIDDDDQEFGHWYALACNAMMALHIIKKRKKESAGALNSMSGNNKTDIAKGIRSKKSIAEEYRRMFPPEIERQSIRKYDIGGNSL